MSQTIINHGKGDTSTYDETVAAFKLIRWRGFSLKNKVNFISEVGSFCNAVELDKAVWQERLSKKVNTSISPQSIDVAKDIQWLKEDGHSFITLFDDQYPDSLRELVDPPLGLFVKGDIRALKSPQVAIVGSRRQTPVGKKIAAQFSQDFSRIGITVTSGLAKGIDSTVHFSACDSGGQTVAVLGCGLDIVYPPQNQALAQLVMQHGCLISEFPVGTPPKRENFPARNRLIAGLSQGVLVVEAAQRSGSLITARLALEQGKDVFAIPGSILSPQSAGCHWLIQQGAVLVQAMDDILFELQLPLMQKSLQNESQCNVKVSSRDDCPILAAVDYDATSVDELCSRTQSDFQTLSSRLMELELDGLVARAHNGDYFRLTSS